MKIRKAGICEYSALYDLQMCAYATEDRLYDYTIPPLLQSREDAIANCCLADLVLVAVDEDERIVGSVRGFLQGDVCHIAKLMVVPSERRCGIGTRLLNAIEQELKAKQYCLFTGTKSRNNLILYRKNGYRTVHTDDANELVYLEKRQKVSRYVDDFEDESVGQCPSHWQESHMPDCIGSNWKIFLVEKNKVYGTEEEFKRTATWLHVFDKDPDVKMKFFSQGISQTAQIGFTIRRAPDTAFVDIVYSFADNRWHIRSQESESAKPQIIQANVIATLKSGQWYSMRIIADGQHLLVYLDDHLIIQTQETKRTGCGRVGVFAQGACLFIDDVDILFRDGDIPQDGLLSYPIIPDVFSHFLELEGLEDQHQLIGVGRKKLISFNEGLTWNDITDDPEWNGLYYNHWYTSLLKLRSNSRYSQIAAKTAFQVSDDLKHWMTEGQIVPEEEQKDEYGRTLVVTHVNSTTEIQLENGSYRLFCPVGFRRYDQEGNIKGHYTKIYFSDDSGKTFRCSKTTTKELLPGYSDDGNTTWCESKVIRCSDNSLRMYYSRNYLGCMHYTVSLDEGETWKGLYAIPEMQNAMTSYAIIEDYSQSTTFYMLRLDGAAEFLGSIFPRNHLMLLKSTDGMNWNFLFHCEWMSDFCSPKNQFPLYQILDPSLFVTDKYVYITYGFSQHEYSPDEPPHHQSQRCYYIRAEKDKLFGKPIYTDHDRDFKTIATSMRQ